MPGADDLLAFDDGALGKAGDDVFDEPRLLGADTTSRLLLSLFSSLLCAGPLIGSDEGRGEFSCPEGRFT